MEILSSPEARLYFALAVNALVLWSAWRAARRVNADHSDAAADAGLIFYLVQYLSVGVPGLLGVLSAASIAVVAIALCAGLLTFSTLRKGDTRVAPTSMSAIVVFGASAAFVVGYALCLMVYQNTLPVISN